MATATVKTSYEKKPKENIRPLGLSHEQNVQFIDRLLQNHPVIWPCYCGTKKVITSNNLRRVMCGLNDEGYDGILILFDNIKDEWNMTLDELGANPSDDVSTERGALADA